jgi:hypothetical protein
MRRAPTFVSFAMAALCAGGLVVACSTTTKTSAPGDLVDAGMSTPVDDAGTSGAAGSDGASSDAASGDSSFGESNESGGSGGVDGSPGNLDGSNDVDATFSAAPDSSAIVEGGGTETSVAEASMAEAGQIEAAAGDTDAGDGSTSDIDPALTVTLTMGSFTVPAGREVFECQTFANPWGAQVDVKTYSASMGAGASQMIAFYAANPTAGSVAACPDGGLTSGQWTFATSTPNGSLAYPSTVGATIPANTGFMLYVHYWNPTESTITAQPSLTMQGATAGTVTQHAGVLDLDNINITVPGSDQPVETTDSYTLAQDVNVIASTSEMAKFATSFNATAGSQTLFSTSQWDDPSTTVFATPLALPSGTVVTWTCTDVNTTSTTLTFGASSQQNVRCVSMSFIYPISDVNIPVIGTGTAL